MAFRYLLYIDILGFSSLVSDDPDRISDLYEIVASLNVHSHPDFKAIVFSDTILVYNISEEWGQSNPSYYIMYLCEFAQDLQARLIGKQIYFRSVLVRGGFHHYESNGIPCFYGDALVAAYLAEKKIKAIGLFMHSSLVGWSDIFRTVKFNEEYAFVFITQGIERVQVNYGGEVPVPRELIEETDEIDPLSRDLLYLREIHANASSQPSAPVRQKYRRTWQIFLKRYPAILRVLAESDFNWNRVSEGADWATYMNRYPATYSWAIKTRVDH